MTTVDGQPDDALVVDLNLAELEQELCRLPDITAARIVPDATRRPIEVHILARPGKPAKQVVRDVQSVALASFGVELDRRIVSVVQLGDNGDGGSRADGDDDGSDFRPRIATINTESNGLRALIQVALDHDGDEAIGFCEGSIATASRFRLIAAATIDALRQIEPIAECVDVDSAQIVRVGIHDVAVVTAVFVVPPTEETVVGSAIVRQNQEAEAIARAVLDATNRRLAQLR